MGAPESGMQAAEQGSGEALLTALRTIKPAERQKHAGVLDYWLSIRGNKEFPPLHDLDPLEISDAGPSSILLELISGGQDAEIRHLGDDLRQDIAVDRIIDAPNPSLLACIAKKLPIVAISRDFLAFEDSYDTADGWTRFWVTLLPLSSCGSWVDYVYAFVSVEKGGGKAVKPVEPVAAAGEEVEPVAEPEAAAEEQVEAVEEEVAAVEPEQPTQPAGPEQAIEEALPDEPEEAPHAKGGPGFGKLLEGFANLTGFYGQSVNIDPAVPLEPEAADEPQAVEPPAPEPEAIEQQAVEPEMVEPEAVEEPLELDEPLELEQGAAAEPDAAEQPVAEPVGEVETEAATSIETEPAPEPAQPAPAMEGSLKSKLDEVQAKADEAREAQLRATQALYQGLSAAYDFALDAENSPEEYLRLVEAQGLKIQLRAPMAPVAKLAFDGVCDAATIRQFESVLAWALKVELPRGALLERIEKAGGIPELLNEFSKAA